MYQKLMHNKSLRLIGGLLGGLLLSVAINVFIVPQGLYGGGAYGLCQVIRTLLQRELSLSLPFDLAGVLYFFVNIPLFLLAYKALGREFFWKAAICTVCNSVFLAVIPSPSTPVIPDLLTSCMVGGILAGLNRGRNFRDTAVLYRMNGSPSVAGMTAPFTDVPSDQWYTDAVIWAYNCGVVDGTSPTQFAPAQNVTREQMATILFRYTKTAAPDKAKASADLSGFADAGSVNDWAVDAMRWAVGQKLIAGITLEQSVYLQPRGNATRAQAATVLTRYYAQ